MSGRIRSLIIIPEFFPRLVLTITNWSVRSVPAVFCNSLSKTIPSNEPDGSSKTNFVMFLSVFLEVTRPHTYKSSFDFTVFADAMDLSFLDSGLSEIILLSLLKRLENKALYPLTPSPVVILLVGSNNTLISLCSVGSSLIPRYVSKSSWLI